ncbi:hypothetical protein HYV83_01705, partial [Candidatus Woesearchaeota archaeon]|nr:hypothetical protein [Candidatus Woesearchaeota archaeon]
TDKKKSLMDSAGKWVGSKEETDRIFKEIYEDRKKFKLRDVNFDFIETPEKSKRR